MTDPSNDPVARPAAGPGAIRVLHVVDTLGVGGLELGLANFIQRTLTDFSHSVCCVRQLGPVADRLSAVAVPIYSLGKPDGHEWGLALRIAQQCRAVRPHIVHTRNWAAFDGVIGARLARVPVLIHSEHGWRDDREVMNRKRKLTRRLLAPLIDRVLTVSEHLQRWLLHEVRIRHDKVVLVRDGVDTQRFKPANDRERLRTQLGYQPGEIVVGAVGRLDPVKNYSALLQAVHILSARHRNLRLLIVGDGVEKAALDGEARGRGLADIVRLAGHHDDVAGWLGIMDVFVLPSVMEGTSIALLEAMAVGLPVVATQVGGNPEVVVDGGTGRLVPARDAAALAAAIDWYALNEDVRGRHGAAGRDRVARHYSMADMIAGYTAVYRDTLARRNRRCLPA